MHLNYRHSGTAVVVFGDGHAKAIFPAQERNLLWYPGGKPPAPAKSGKKPKGRS
jgi:prepilin-type processing-associated H-X9-DG protein